MISIIIPVYNEETILLSNSQAFQRLSRAAELIFADGGSSDKSAGIASAYGRVVHCKKARSLQMNEGVSSCRQEIVLFLHADNYIFPEALFSIEHAIKDKGVIGGCLTQRIDSKSWIYRAIESQGNIRARLSKVFYGDQGIFVRKDIFFKARGFPEVPIMEDVLFSKRLKAMGNTVVLPDKIFVSPRRWEKEGIVKTIMLYTLIGLLFRLRCPLDKIKRLYDDLR